MTSLSRSLEQSDDIKTVRNRAILNHSQVIKCISHKISGYCWCKVIICIKRYVGIKTHPYQVVRAHKTNLRFNPFLVIRAILDGVDCRCYSSLIKFCPMQHADFTSWETDAQVDAEKSACGDRHV